MAYNNIFSMPVSRKRQISMRRRFIVFSSFLFLLIFFLGSAIFIILMNQILHKNAGNELSQTVEIERLKLEASINGDIAVALKMAGSPLIRRHFLNPGDGELRTIALDEIAGYREAFAGNTVFWINDIDKKFYLDDAYSYTVDTADPDNYWYMLTLNGKGRYNFNINYNPDLNVTNLWINATVLDGRHKPVGIIGTGINLDDFINNVYKNYSGTADMFFFKADGEITGAKDVGIVEKKENITGVLGQIGDEILSRSRKLRNRDVIYFETKDKRQIIAVGSVQDFNWYITAVRSFDIGASLHTGMTVLFGVMMAVIFFIFVIFNIFIVGMLEPLNQMVKTITQTFNDWDMRPKEDGHYKDEIGTLGEFFHLTIIDQLSGIYNRRYLDGNLKKIIKFYSRTGGSLSVLMIDIDYFKKYNDAYGHDAGDSCLKTVAAAISKCITRDEDFVARYGGEEFTVVLPNTDKNGAQAIAEKILDKVRECDIPHEKSGAAVYVTVSIGGTAGVIKHFQHGSDYIKAADRALYESKKNGRNRYTFMAFQ